MYKVEEMETGREAFLKWMESHKNVVLIDHNKEMILTGFRRPGKLKGSPNLPDGQDLYETRRERFFDLHGSLPVVAKFVPPFRQGMMVMVKYKNHEAYNLWNIGIFTYKWIK